MIEGKPCIEMCILKFRVCAFGALASSISVIAIVIMRVKSTETGADRRFIGDSENVLNSTSLV